MWRPIIFFPLILTSFMGASFLVGRDIAGTGSVLLSVVGGLFTVLPLYYVGEKSVARAFEGRGTPQTAEDGAGTLGLGILVAYIVGAAIGFGVEALPAWVGWPIAGSGLAILWGTAEVLWQSRLVLPPELFSAGSRTLKEALRIKGQPKNE